MLTFGMAIHRSNDPLQKVKIETVAKKIKMPKPEFVSRISQLRKIRLIDEKQYKRLKISLPYFCCGIFNPGFRRKENFAAINFFTIDLDHFSEEHLSKEKITQKLMQEEQVRLLFTSPGGDGLKAVFQLKEACTDAGQFSHFYKAFSRDLAKRYGLEKVIDWVTHDVTRATFFSADPKAWDNPSAAPVSMNNFISENIDDSFSVIEKEFDTMAKDNPVQQQEQVPGSPDQGTLTIIKRKLNPNYKPKKKKNIYIPEEINEALPLVKEALEKEQMNIATIRPIYYGKQLKIFMDKYWAEINIFYGQKGFSVVKTTKTGSNSELAELAFQVIDTVLN